MTQEQKIILVIGGWLIVAVIGWILVRRIWQGQLATNRIILPNSDELAEPEIPEPGKTFVGRYVRMAGYHQSWAGTALVCSIVACLLIGFLAAWIFRVSGLSQMMLTGVEAVPGGLSGILVPIVLVAPWLSAVIIAAIPVLLVRSTRRGRVKQVQRDMPLALDLWATLAEGGLGFDAALERWLQTQPAKRALAQTARGYRRDLLAGMKRVDALRRWSERLQVPAVTRFTGAMIQSEQSGSSISETLRLQAEDVRANRREKAMTFAQSLATKRIIPLVICFLPGLFVWPLGPFFVELLRIVDQLVGTR